MPGPHDGPGIAVVAGDDLASIVAGDARFILLYGADGCRRRGNRPIEIGHTQMNG